MVTWSEDTDWKGIEGQYRMFMGSLIFLGVRGGADRFILLA